MPRGVNHHKAGFLMRLQAHAQRTAARGPPYPRHPGIARTQLADLPASWQLARRRPTLRGWRRCWQARMLAGRVRVLAGRRGASFTWLHRRTRVGQRSCCALALAGGGCRRTGERAGHPGSPCLAQRRGRVRQQLREDGEDAGAADLLQVRSWATSRWAACACCLPGPGRLTWKQAGSCASLPRVCSS